MAENLMHALQYNSYGGGAAALKGDDNGQTLKGKTFDMDVTTLMLGCQDTEPLLPQMCKTSTRNQPGANC
ncbi:hypothetical protein Godav_015214 [Gossypium davidsonii]|uniref:Uncharacterized protein n=1 Tax=Gossypium davidsonii TaxID=34287 RepID=A0A7J8RN43_GOSDV|nr:hypothetical protein [Gossypium davidsonii]